jgi:hypothetical protein
MDTCKGYCVACAIESLAKDLKERKLTCRIVPIILESKTFYALCPVNGKKSLCHKSYGIKHAKETYLMRSGMKAINVLFC